MIGACDCCDRQHVPVSHFRADQTSAQCETTACYLCQGETDADPYGELYDEAMAACDAALNARPPVPPQSVLSSLNVGKGPSKEGQLLSKKPEQDADESRTALALDSHQGNCK